MHDTATDLTRRDGAGASVAAKLPGDPAERLEAGRALIDRAVQRWALFGQAEVLHAATASMLEAQRHVEPLHLCIRLAGGHATLVIGSRELVVPLALSSAA